MALPATIEARQRELLELLAAIPLAESTEPSPDAITRLSERDPSVPHRFARQIVQAHPWRRSIFKHTASMLLGRDLAEASAWFRNADNHIVGEWEALILLRCYHALKKTPHFAGNGTEASVRSFLVDDLLPRVRAENAGLGKFSTSPTAWCGSENHTIIGFSIRLLLEELAGEDIDRDHWGYPADQIPRWCLEKATRGYTEFFSTHYTERCLAPLLNIADCSTDAGLREVTSMAVDLLVAEYALIQINGFRGGAVRRCYQVWTDDTHQPEMTDSRHDCCYPMGQVFFGDAVTESPFQYNDGEQTIGYLYYATTGYRPSPVHLEIVRPEVRGNLEIESARRWEHEDAQPQEPDTCITAYATPHYVLSSIRVPDKIQWGHGNIGVNGGVPYRLSFRKPRAMVGTARDGENAWLTDPLEARALFQHESTVLYSGKVDSYREVDPPIGPGEGIGLEEQEGAFRPYREAGAEGEQVYAGVREENGVGVMEVRLASQHESWEAFKTAFKGNAAELESRERMCYTTCDGIAIELEGRRVAVDGKPQATDGWPLYRSRLINGDWWNQSEDAGRITIGDETTGRLVLDFRDLERSVREEME